MSHNMVTAKYIHHNKSSNVTSRYTLKHAYKRKHSFYPEIIHCDTFVDRRWRGPNYKSVGLSLLQLS